ncbi:MAG: hypothetical protein ACOCY1_06060, partial [Halovenus sp.]
MGCSSQEKFTKQQNSKPTYEQQESPEAVGSRDSLSFERPPAFRDDERAKLSRTTLQQVLASSGFADSLAPFSPTRIGWPTKLCRVGLKGAVRSINPGRSKHPPERSEPRMVERAGAFLLSITPITLHQKYLIIPQKTPIEKE